MSKLESTRPAAKTPQVQPKRKAKPKGKAKVETKPAKELSEAEMKKAHGGQVTLAGRPQKLPKPGLAGGGTSTDPLVQRERRRPGSK